MSQVVKLELPDDIYTALKQQAESIGISLSELIFITLEQKSNIDTKQQTEAEKEYARQRFRSHAGTINLDYQTNIDNESIDADLIKAYSGDLT